MQLCEPNRAGAHTFRVFASSNGTFTAVQDVMKTWSTGGCLSFPHATYITGLAVLATGTLQPTTDRPNTKLRRPLALRRPREPHWKRGTPAELFR